mgnify:CR=1 FL=1
MARYTGPKSKIARKFGEPIFALGKYIFAVKSQYSVNIDNQIDSLRDSISFVYPIVEAFSIAT